MNQRQRKILVEMVNQQAEARTSEINTIYRADEKGLVKQFREDAGVTKLESEVNKKIKAVNRLLTQARKIYSDSPLLSSHYYGHDNVKEFHANWHPDTNSPGSKKLQTLLENLRDDQTDIRNSAREAVIAIEMSGSEVDLLKLVDDLDLAVGGYVRDRIENLLR